MMAGVFVAALLSILLALPVVALAAERTDVARLSRILDETYILAQDDVEWSYAEQNLPLENGDLIQTDETGMAEIQFGSALIVRLGERSRAAIIETEDQKVVGIENGRAYVRVIRDVPSGEALVITFPNGQLLAHEKALARIDIFEEGGAELRVIRGTIELEPLSETPATVESGESVLISAEGTTEYRPLEVATTDAFDEWNEERDIALSKYHQPEYIEEDIIGAEDLDGYGEWVYVKRYKTHAWRPYVVSTWRPYYYGRWYHSRYRGWVWVAGEPWGYATHHYGSWNYDPYYGWVWIPGYTWRPAYVHWVTYDDYIGWVPIGYYGRPVITVYPYYVSGLYIDYFDTFSFTFVFRSHFHYYHYYHHRHHKHHYKHRHDYHRVDVIDHTDDGKRIRKGRVRFLDDNDFKKLNLERERYKGRLVRERFEHEGILDVDNHPRMRDKIVRLDERRERYEKRRVESPAAERPEKLQKDDVRSFDFRDRVERHDKIPARKELRAKTRTTPDFRIRGEQERTRPAERRERIDIERPQKRMRVWRTDRTDNNSRERVAEPKSRVSDRIKVDRPEIRPPVRRTTDTTNVEKRPAVDSQPQTRARWDLSDIKQRVRERDESPAWMRERRSDRRSLPEREDRYEEGTHDRVGQNRYPARTEVNTDRPARRMEAMKFEASRNTQRPMARELSGPQIRREMPQRGVDMPRESRPSGRMFTRPQRESQERSRGVRGSRDVSRGNFRRSFGRNR
jgi:hypothetical protein